MTEQPRAEIELAVLRPQDQVRLQDIDAYSDRALLTLIEITQRAIATDGVGCLRCQQRITTTRAITYAVAVGAGFGRCEPICTACADAHDDRDLSTVACNSLTERLLAEAAAERHAFIAPTTGSA